MKLAMICAFIIFNGINFANGSDSLSYSGRLVNADGSPVTGLVDLKFDFVYTSNTSTILCEQQIPNVPLTNGVFHTKLDPDCTLSASTFVSVLANVPANKAVAIRVTDETHAKAYSYQALHSMPYSTIAKQLDKLGATTGQVLAWDGSKWGPVTPSNGTGSVTSVATGAGLTGGPITTSGTISIADGGVTNAKLASGIARAKLATGTANAVLINNGAGVLSEASQLPLSMGGTGASTASDARTSLGLGTAAVANIGTAVGDVMGADAVPVCLAFEKLQMSVGPVYAWSCVADDNVDATKLPLAGGTMSGVINMGNQLITNLATPTGAAHAATKAYVDALASQWTTLSSNIYFNTANVGIGTTTPAEKLSVVGNVAVTGNLKLQSDTANFINLKAPAALSANLVMNLPGTNGATGNALITDGAGNLSWAAVATSSSAVGGDLSGTISNATIITGAVTSAKIADATIADVDISPAAGIAQSKIANLTTDLAAKELAIAAGTTLQYWRGDKSWQTLNTTVVPEGANLYFTKPRVLGTDLAGYSAAAGTITSADTLLTAIEKLQGNITALSASSTTDFVDAAGDTMSGVLAMGNNKITNLATPTAGTDAATKAYVDAQVTSASDWTKTVSDLSYTAGKVSIGTATPGNTTFRVVAGFSNPTAIFESACSGCGAGPMVYNNVTTNNSTAYLGFGSGGAGNPQFMGSIGAIRLNSNVDSALVFSTTLVGGTSERMRLDHNGRLGIGLTSPTERLHVEGNVNVTGDLKLKSDNANFVQLRAPSSLASTLSLIFPGTNGAAGNALITDGAGNLSWAAVATSSSAVGGDLSGTIANATIITGAVTSAKIADATIADVDISPAAGIAQSKIANLTTDLAAKELAIAAGTTLQYWRGDKSWQTLNTTVVPEGANLYFTKPRVLGTDLAGYSAAAGTITSADTLLTAIEKLQGNITALSANSTIAFVDAAGDTMSGVLAMGNNKITNLATPTAGTDAATKAYVDAQVSSASDWTKTVFDLSYTAGKVSVGTSIPVATAQLTVNGAISTNSSSIILGDTNGNARGAPSVDIQASRSANTQVAAGTNSTAVGINNTVGGTQPSTAIGFNNQASAFFWGGAVAVGSSNIANGSGSVALGIGNGVGTSDAGTAIGFNNSVSGHMGIAIGTSNSAGTDAIAFGRNVNNSIANSMQLGPSDAAKVTLLSSGNFGVGTVTPVAKLDIQGQARTVSTGGVAKINTTAAVDWNNGNAQSMSVACTSTAFTNMLEGGTYMLAVTETGTSTCVFSQSGLTFYFNPANGARTSGQRSVYSFMRIGNDVYVSWIAGFQ